MLRLRFFAVSLVEMSRAEAERYAETYLMGILKEDDELRRNGGDDGELYLAVKRQVEEMGGKQSGLATINALDKTLHQKTPQLPTAGF
jgi:hypothetical protein